MPSALLNAKITPFKDIFCMKFTQITIANIYFTLLFPVIVSN